MKIKQTLLSLCLVFGLSFTASAAPVLSIDFNERGTGPETNTQAGFSSFLINSNVSTTAIQTNATTRVFGGITVTLSNTAPLGYDDRLRAAPVNSATFTNALLLRDVIFSREVNGNGGLDLAITGLTPDQHYRAVIWSYDSLSGGLRVSDWSANGTLVKENYTFDGRVLPTRNTDYQFSFVIAADSTGLILIQGRRDSTSVGTTGVADLGVFLNALQLEPTVPEPVITAQPSGGTRGLGDRMTFTVRVDGVLPLTYRWFKGGMEIPDATANSLTLSNLTVADSADYTVQIMNAFSTATSDIATLTVLPDPAPDVRQGLVSHWPMDIINDFDFPATTPDRYSANHMNLITTGFYDATAGAFDNAILFNGTEQHAVRQGGFPIYNNSALTVALWVNAVGTGQSDRRFFAESSTNSNNPLFVFGTQTTGLNGTMRVYIRNDANGVILDRHSTRPALDGTWHHVVWVENNGQGKLYIDGQLDESDFTYTRGTVSLNQTVLAAILRSTGTVNPFTGALDDVAVWSRPLSFTEIQEIRTTGIPLPVGLIPPAITQQPASQSVLTRSKVTFSFGATGTSPLDVQWRKGSVNLPGETGGTLVLNNVMLGDAGDYSVIVANSGGRATSDVATLTVTLRPPPPTDLKVDFNNLDPDNTEANTEAGFAPFALPAFGAGPFTRSFGGADVTLLGAGANLESRKRLAPVNGGGFTEEKLLQDLIFAREATLESGLDLGVEFLEPNTSYAVTIWSFDNSSGGSRVSDWSINNTLVKENYTFDGRVLPASNADYRFSFVANTDSAGSLWIQGRRDLTSVDTAGAASFGVFVNALQVKRRELRVQRIEILPGGFDLNLVIEVLNPGAVHRIEEKTALGGGDWSEVSGVVFNQQGGNVLHATFALPGDGTHFYRVVELP